MSKLTKVTVCQISDKQEEFKTDWVGLVNHINNNQSDIVLLPEIPFSEWLAYTKEVDPTLWEKSVLVNDHWLNQLDQLSANVVLGTRPVIGNGTPYNEAFIWKADNGLKPSHRKYYLPEEPGFWEASWYRRGPKEFITEEVDDLNLGFLICTEMWFTEHARSYARQGIHLLASPRATERSTVDRWIAGGRAAAIMAGAYSISSNKSGRSNGVDFGGCGWVIDPSGNVLATTSDEEPFITVEIDIHAAEEAKKTYPRYVEE